MIDIYILYIYFCLWISLIGVFAQLTVFTGHRRAQRHTRPWKAHGRDGHHAGMCRRQVSVWRQCFKSLQGNQRVYVIDCYWL